MVGPHKIHENWATTKSRFSTIHACTQSSIIWFVTTNKCGFFVTIYGKSKLRTCIVWKSKKKSWSINFWIVRDNDNYFFKLKWNELHAKYLLYKNRNIVELILLSLYWYFSPMPKFLMGCVIPIKNNFGISNYLKC